MCQDKRLRQCADEEQNIDSCGVSSGVHRLVFWQCEERGLTPELNPCWEGWVGKLSGSRWVHLGPGCEAARSERNAQRGGAARVPFGEEEC